MERAQLKKKSQMDSFKQRNCQNLIKCYKCGKIGKGVEVNIRPSSNGEFVNFISYKKD